MTRRKSIASVAASSIGGLGFASVPFFQPSTLVLVLSGFGLEICAAICALCISNLID